MRRAVTAAHGPCRFARRLQIKTNSMLLSSALEKKLFRKKERNRIVCNIYVI